MKYLDPNAHGPLVQQQTLYKNFQTAVNDVKIKREEFSQAQDHIPNNTFIRLFN